MRQDFASPLSPVTADGPQQSVGAAVNAPRIVGALAVLPFAGQWDGARTIERARREWL
jgi:hypothetical protein